MSRTTEEERAARRSQVASMTAVGMPAAQIADVLRITARTVQRDRTRSGARRPSFPRITPEQVQQMRGFAADGVPAGEIARTLGVSATSVRRHCPEAAWTQSQAGSWGRELDRIRAGA